MAMFIMNFILIRDKSYNKILKWVRIDTNFLEKLLVQILVWNDIRLSGGQNWNLQNWKQNKRKEKKTICLTCDEKGRWVAILHYFLNVICQKQIQINNWDWCHSKLMIRSHQVKFNLFFKWSDWYHSDSVVKLKLK